MIKHFYSQTEVKYELGKDLDVIWSFKEKKLNKKWNDLSWPPFNISCLIPTLINT